ncbi:MAG: methionine--tRNA ligase subunit beta [Candidatus Pacebacteria bacterium]|nr:methionine--tRNA ligase subunit beta [Candidatus Paceibacterota bacterium]
MIKIDDFQKIDLRIGTILEAEKVEGSEKLLKLKVDFGAEVENSPRQILSGIAKHYSPEDLIGKQVVAIINLEPRTMMGLESQGMLLASSNGEKLALLKTYKKMKPGSKIS